jgi:hypothetical protein
VRRNGSSGSGAGGDAGYSGAVGDARSGVNLSQVRAVSVRQFNPPPGSAGTTDPLALVSCLVQWATGDIPPATFQLRACRLIVGGNPPAGAAGGAG